MDKPHPRNLAACRSELPSPPRATRSRRGRTTLKPSGGGQALPETAGDTTAELFTAGRRWCANCGDSSQTAGARQTEAPLMGQVVCLVVTFPWQGTPGGRGVGVGKGGGRGVRGQGQVPRRSVARPTGARAVLWTVVAVFVASCV